MLCFGEKESGNFSYKMKKKINSLRDFTFEGRKNQRGFTLIEVLVVLTIIAVFILAALWAYQIQIFKGRDAKRKSDLSKLQRVLEDYLNDHICYPESLDCSSDFAPYLSQIPCDPVNSRGHIYYYSVAPDESCKKWYKIFTTLEYLKDPIIEKIGCNSETCGAFNYVVSSPNVEVLTRQLGEIFPPPYPPGVPTPVPGETPTPTPTGDPTPTPSPTGDPTPTPTPTGDPTPTPCPGGWFTCTQDGICNYVGNYQLGAVCDNTCNSCTAPGCLPNCAP